MENSTIRLNLAALTHVVTTVKGKSGNQVEGIFIPLEKNKIFKGTKGLYLDLVAFPMKQRSESKDTHLIKQSFSKEEREKMSREELESLPIIGNMTDWNYVQRGNTDPDLDSGAPIITDTELPY